MAKKSASSNGLVREAYPSHILFEERGGVYWLRGPDLEQAKKVLPIRPDSPSVGFDKVNMSVHANRLHQSGLKVGILKDGAVRTLQFPGKKKSAKVPSTPIGLAPSLILDKCELERLERRLTRKSCAFKDLTQRIRAELSNGRRASVSDYGKVYVHEAWEGAYEVDFELTSMSRTTFEALALATHLSRQKLLCHLVAPKSRRKKNGATTQPAAVVSQPVTYGQLKLLL